MDKNREVRRGGGSSSRYPPAKRQPRTSGPKLVSAFNGRDVDGSDKSRKPSGRGSSLGKANEVSSLNKRRLAELREEEGNEGAGGNIAGVSSAEDTDEKFGDSEMGGSDGEEEHRPQRIFKVHGKALDDCNGVDPAAVPRKLRSAVNKRNRESVSPPFPDAKKPHHPLNGVELAATTHVNGARKSKQNLKKGSMERSSKKVTVTKDEEEVAETLFALARMVPRKPVKRREDRKATDTKPGSLPETRTRSGPSSEGYVSGSATSEEKRTKPANVSTGAVTVELSPVEEDSVKGTVKIEPPSEQTVSGCEKLDLEPHNTAGADLQRISPLSRNQPTTTTPLNESTTANSFHPTEVSTVLSSVNGFSLSPLSRSEAVPVREPENRFLPVKQEEPVKLNVERSSLPESAEGGARDLWPCLSTTSCDVDGHLEWASSTKAAPWPVSVTCAARSGSTGNDISKEKLPQALVGGRQSWKRCATHVYICRLIQVQQSAEKKLRWPMLQSNHSKSKEGKKAGVEATGDQASSRNSLNSMLSGSANTERGLRVVPEKRLLQDQQAATTSAGIYPQQKQNGDFLSLSADEAPSNSGKLSDGMDTSGQVHVPYSHPFVQHHPVLPFSLQPARFSSAYSDQMAAAAAAAASQQVQWQLPQYLSNPFYAPPLGSAASGKQQQQQQQQQMWAAQLAQYRAGAPTSHIPKRQNGGYDAHTVIPCSQITSASPIEVVGPKYSPNTQLLYTVSPSSSTRGGKKQPQQHPDNYDEVSCFRSEGPHHLQLLCNADCV